MGGERLWINVGCGPHLAPSPYFNIDCHEDDTIKPDLVVPADAPLSIFDSGSVERLIASHVLEHVPWHAIPAFCAEMRRVIRDDNGRVCVVGPDVERTLLRWKDGLEPWSLVEAVLEGSKHYQPTSEEWPEARHHWNATAARTAGALEAAGFACKPVEMDSPELDDWFVVSRAPWQFALLAEPA